MNNYNPKISIIKSKTKKYIFQPYSDLHIERKGFYPDIHPINPSLHDYGDAIYICLLAGDIGCVNDPLYYEFLRLIGSRFNFTYVILGNHEYNGNSIEYVDRIIKYKNIPNVTFLQKNSIYFPDIDTLLLGCTLWSYIPKGAKNAVERTCSNYKNINNFNTFKNNKLFIDHYTWLEDNLNGPESIKIVMTHHTPSIHGTNTYLNTRLLTVYNYSTDIPDLLKKANIWVCGHTHYNPPSNTINIEGCLVVLNQMGYSKFSPEKDFNLNCGFIIEQ